ncbi:CocE/NonD family hydrolase [Aurantiacibacter gangjinensis]|uniref:CocE/NonD family hydrolase n=1 Tax=Aurantiacibacter gangjinensis TaxID=502682 RepID=UPI000AF15882|nr:CocE/NonD family hydrolase [Aurantiacibacter gangjinensis]
MAAGSILLFLVVAAATERHLSRWIGLISGSLIAATLSYRSQFWAGPTFGEGFAAASLVLGAALLCVVAVSAGSFSRRRLAVPAVVAGGIVATIASMSAYAHAGPTTRHSIAIASHDGTLLAADIYLPRSIPADGLSAILMQTRYNRGWSVRWPWRFVLTGDAPLADAFTRGDFAYVAVDARGSGASEGEQAVSFSPEERADGPALAGWIRRQSWSNATVYGEGISYAGVATDLAWSQGALDGAVVAFAPYDILRDTVWPGGLLAETFARRWSLVTTSLDAGEPERVFASLARFVSGVRPLDSDPDGTALAALIASRRNYVPYDLFASAPFRGDLVEGQDVWSRANFTYRAPQGAPPRLVIGGWYDGGNTNAALRRLIHDPGSHLLIGPWDHGGRQIISPCEDDEAKVLDYPRVVTDFLRSSSTTTGQSRVRYFTMCGGGWKESSSWPVADVRSQTLYLSGTSLNSRAAPYFPRTLIVDPSATTGKGSRWLSPANFDGTLIEYTELFDQSQHRLTFETGPLRNDMILTGNAVIETAITADAADASVFAYLEDVGPAGDVRYITEGQIRASHAALAIGRDALYEDVIPHRTLRAEHRRALSLDEPLILRFGMQATSYRIAAGRRLRLSFAGADHDNFAAVPDGASRITFHSVDGRAPTLDLPIEQ